MGAGSGRVAKDQVAKDAVGNGLIPDNRISQGFNTLADKHVLPAVVIDYDACLKIKEYINSVPKLTTAIVFLGTAQGNSGTPAVSCLSSGGPSRTCSRILKPDIIGPGVSILATWPFVLNNMTDIKPNFNIASGTSVACPHFSGISAVLKSSHPDWPPAAIKSVIMTTADTTNMHDESIRDQHLAPVGAFAIGAGQINPSKANDLGPISDIRPDDYISYLCGLGYSNTGRLLAIPCIPEAQFNYPLFSLTFVDDTKTMSYLRTVTNVSLANCKYTSAIKSPPGIDVRVYTEVIEFMETNRMVTFSTTDMDFFPVCCKNLDCSVR